MNVLQVTRMCSGNEIEWHLDSPHFGDVIITVGLTGSAAVQLKRASKDKLGVKAQHLVPSPPLWLATTFTSEGEAYVLSGPSRHRYEHRITADPTLPNAPEYGEGVARVGLTLRYFRRSFCQVETRRLVTDPTIANAAATPAAPTPAASAATVAEGATASTTASSSSSAAAGAAGAPPAWPTPLTEAEQQACEALPASAEPHSVIDVKAATNPKRNPFTYPALVLGSELRVPDRGGPVAKFLASGRGSGTPSAAVRMLCVQFLSDRRTTAVAAEAAVEGDWVHASMGIASTEATVRRCCQENPMLAEIRRKTGSMTEQQAGTSIVS